MREVLVLTIVFCILTTIGCTQTPTGKAVSDIPLGDVAAEYKETAYEQTTDSIIIDEKAVKTSIKMYSYTSDGVKIRFFVVKDSDGMIRTAFDTCSLCESNKGFRQDMFHVINNENEYAFQIDQLGRTNSGDGYYPAHLANDVKDGKVIISKDDLVNGKNLFS